MIAMRRLPQRRALRFALVLIWMALIFALSSRSRLPQPSEELIGPFAIAAHLFTYGVLAGLLYRALETLTSMRWPMVLLVVVLTTLYGVSDEIHQSFVSGRSATAFDVAVDFVGATLASVGCHAFLLSRRDGRMA